MTIRRSIQWNVVVIGGANYEYLVRGETRLPESGDAVSGEILQEGPGGKGANQAMAAARLGGRVAFVGRVGADEHGDAIVKQLALEGVDTRYILRDAQTPTGVAVVGVEENGRKKTLVTPGANHKLTVADIYAAKTAIWGAQVTLTQLEIPLECVMASILFASDAGVQMVLEPGPLVSLPLDLLRLVTVLKPNAREAEALTGLRVHNRASARAAAEQLLKRGVGAVAIEAGSEGTLLVWGYGRRQRELWLPRLPVDCIDLTGAGNAFAGALAVALAEGYSLLEAGPFASAAAALKTTKLGVQAGLPRRGEIMSLLAKINSKERSPGSEISAASPAERWRELDRLSYQRAAVAVKNGLLL